MELDSALVFTIRHPDRHVEELEVDSERALVGSGSHCEIRLPPEVVSPEQILLEARSGGVFATARSFDPPTLLLGAPFSQGRLAEDAEFELGAYRLSVVVRERRQLRSKAIAPKLSPTTWLAFAVLIPATLAMLVYKPDGQGGFPAKPVPPSLWQTDASQGCAGSEGSESLVLAEQLLARARAKEERAPYRSGDGIAAVHLMERASTCFDHGGEDHRTNEIRAQIDGLKRQLDAQYHIHNVRLDRALKTQNWTGASTEIRALLELVGQRSDDYSIWLSSALRRIQLKFDSGHGQKNKKKT